MVPLKPNELSRHGQNRPACDTAASSTGIKNEADTTIPKCGFSLGLKIDYLGAISLEAVSAER